MFFALLNKFVTLSITSSLSSLKSLKQQDNNKKNEMLTISFKKHDFYLCSKSVISMRIIFISTSSTTWCEDLRGFKLLRGKRKRQIRLDLPILLHHYCLKSRGFTLMQNFVLYAEKLYHEAVVVLTTKVMMILLVTVVY